MSLPEGLRAGDDGVTRCWWCGTDPLYTAYHDDEWGRPMLDDHRLFEKICLEGFQSGLSWLTILKKREGFREAFDGFDFEKIARYRATKVDKLLENAAIVRHRGKIEATLNNAKQAIRLAEEAGSLAAYFWSFEPGPEERPARCDKASLTAMTTTPAAQALSKDLKKRGWRFVGPTTCYAFMQAMGLVNDHLEGCAHRAPCLGARKATRVPTHGATQVQKGDRR
ncbi:MAG: DNA-3-methyladenine glycosylase I [Myxococcales bacterium]|nr:DNA-3-methyladenine glycosylase I [Myxococcales bacterium]